MPSSWCAPTLQHCPRVGKGGAGPLNRCHLAAETQSRTNTCIFLLTCSRACSMGGAGSSVRGSFLSILELFPWEETLSQLSLSAVHSNEWPLWEISIINLCPIIFAVNLLFSCWVSFLQGSRKVNCSVRCSLGKITRRNLKWRWKQVPRACDPSSQQFQLLGLTMLDANIFPSPTSSLPSLSEWEEQARNLPYCSQSSKPSLLAHITLNSILH